MKPFSSVVAAAATSGNSLGSSPKIGAEYDLQPFPTATYASIVITSLLLPVLLTSPAFDKLLTRHALGVRACWVGAFLANLLTVSLPGRFDGQAAAAEKAAKGDSGRSGSNRAPTYKGGIPWTPVFAPAGWAFAIWGAIFLGEALITAYVGAVGVPADTVALGLRAALWWTAGNLYQSLWTFAFRPPFSDHLYVPATLLGLAAASVLGAHGTVTSWMDAEVNSLWRKAGLLLFRLPLSLHGSWLCAACLLNLNSWAARVKLPMHTQVAMAMSSAFGAAGLGAALTLSRGDPFIALTFAWALSAVGAQTVSASAREMLKLPAVTSESLALACRALAKALIAVALVVPLFRGSDSVYSSVVMYFAAV